jgi:hypothetical protein
MIQEDLTAEYPYLITTRKLTGAESSIVSVYLSKNFGGSWIQYHRPDLVEYVYNIYLIRFKFKEDAVKFALHWA